MVHIREKVVKYITLEIETYVNDKQLQKTAMRKWSKI